MKVLFFLFFHLQAFAFAPPVESAVDQVVSVFENGTPDLQYDYIENLQDGRGYTAGRAGFTTATGDLLLVVNRYLARSPDQVLRDLLPMLQERAADHDDSVAGLERLSSVWKSAAAAKAFRDAQDEVNDELYKTPARNHALELGLRTALGFLIVYDTIIQHGDGSDPDGFRAIVKRSRPGIGTDAEFLQRFLRVREDVLLHPSSAQTSEEWAASVDRVYALRKLIAAGEWNLRPPLKLHVWGDDFTIR